MRTPTCNRVAETMEGQNAMTKAELLKKIAKLKCCGNCSNIRIDSVDGIWCDITPSCLTGNDPFNVCSKWEERMSLYMNNE